MVNVNTPPGTWLSRGSGMLVAGMLAELLLVATELDDVPCELPAPKATAPAVQSRHATVSATPV